MPSIGCAPTWRRRLFGLFGVLAAGLVCIALPSLLEPAQAWPEGHPAKRTYGQDNGALLSRTRAKRPDPQPLLAVVSLADQRLSVYGAAGLVAHAPVSTGMAGFPTPTGVFSIIQKRRYHRSNIYSGAPMPFMQRITWSGIALHAGLLPGYPASHGCIRLPPPFAERLWAMTRVGVRVIIAPHDAPAVEVTHASLPMPLLTPPPALTETEPRATGPAVLVAVEAAPGGTARLVGPVERAQAAKVKAGADLAVAQRQARAALETAKLLALESKGAIAALREAQSVARAARETLPIGEDPLAAARAHEAETWRAALAAAQAVKYADAALEAAEAALEDANRRSEPLSVFVSRKEGRVFVRQGFRPVIDAPVAIRDPEQPLGTHVFVALAAQEEGRSLRWSAVTVPPRSSSLAPRGWVGPASRERPLPSPPPAAKETARTVLDRVVLPEDVVRVVSDRLWTGASLIVSDHGLGNETNEHTDFILLTR